MSRNVFVLSLIFTCWIGFIAFTALERRAPYGGDRPQIIAVNR